MNQNSISLSTQDIDNIKRAIQNYNSKPRVQGKSNNRETKIVENIINTLILGTATSSTSKPLPNTNYDNDPKPKPSEETSTFTSSAREENKVKEKAPEKVEEKYDKGWNIDDTLQLEVDIKTMFDILRPIRLANEHEKRVLAIIERIYPYIIQSDKHQKDKTVSQSLKNELGEVNFEYVRHIYRQAVTLAIEEYNKVPSI